MTTTQHGHKVQSVERCLTSLVVDTSLPEVCPTEKDFISETVCPLRLWKQADPSNTQIPEKLLNKIGWRHRSPQWSIALKAQTGCD